MDMSFSAGPKYLEAITAINEVADIKAIEIELPTLRDQATVSPLTGIEEQSLRTASISPSAFLKRMNEILFDHTKFEKTSFTDFGDFLKNIYAPDRALLTFALLVSSYIVLPEIEVKCEKCGENNIVEKTPDELFHPDTITKIWDKPLPPSEYTESQEILDGHIIIEFGMPSEFQRLVVLKLMSPNDIQENVQQTGELTTFIETLAFLTRKIIVNSPEGQIILTDLAQDIFPFLQKLPPKISDAIKQKVKVDIFDEYMPNFYLETVCSHCGHEQKVEVDVEMLFFRKTMDV
jgi:ribosomal protein S27E